MHTLFIHQIFLTPKEAGSTRHFELAKHLVKKGNKVTIIGSTVSYLTGTVEKRFKGKFIHKEIIQGVEIVRVWAYSKIHKSYVKRVFSFISFMFSSIIAGLKTKKIDAIIACSPQIFTGISGFILSKLKKVPFIFEVRDLWPKFAIETGVISNPVIIRLAEFLEKSIYKRADYFIINSPGFNSHLINFGIQQNKIFLIPNGVDTQSFKPENKHNRIRKELGLDKNFVVLYSGAHGKANDLDTIIHSANLLSDHSDITFLLVGDGKEKKRLIRLRDKYNLKNVIFAGAQPKNRMPEYCNAADVCIAILKKLDSFKTTYPNKIFDYMACGRPTILAIDGVAREVIEKAKAGEFVEPENPEQLANKVLKFYKNQDLIKEYGINSRKYVVEHFDRERIAKNLNTALNEVLK